MLRFSDTPTPADAKNSLRLGALAYGATLLPMVGAVFPRADDVVWPWMFVGAAVVAAVAASVQRMAKRILDPQRTYTPSPRVLLAQNIAMYLTMGCFGYGLSGLGTYRFLLLGPLLFISVIGNRAMFVTSYLCCLATIIATTAGSLTDMQLLPAVTVATAGGFLVFGVFTREVTRITVRKLRHSQRFAELAAIAAGAETIEAGVDAMLPVAGSYLHATAASAYTVHSRRVSDAPLAAWPALPALTDQQAADLRIAAIDRRVVLGDAWACVPVANTEGTALVLYVERSIPNFVDRTILEDSLAQVAAQLGVLLTRLSLIARLETLTETDGLTELPNRRALQHRMDHDMAVAARTHTPVSVVMIDIDNFKSYNDTYGHPAGDQILKGVAQMMNARLRSTDFVARYGGEEFCAVLPVTGGADAAVVFTELHRRCREIPAERTVTFSAGVAEWDGCETVDRILERADRALYVAKQSGRDRTCVDQPDRVHSVTV